MDNKEIGNGYFVIVCTLATKADDTMTSGAQLNTTSVNFQPYMKANRIQDPKDAIRYVKIANLSAMPSLSFSRSLESLAFIIGSIAYHISLLCDS